MARQANSEGISALRAGNGEAAAAAFLKATAADPEAGPLWRNLAHAQRLCGDTVQEQASLNRALSLDRTDFVAHLRLAQLLERTGQEVAALSAWAGTIQLAAHQPPLAAEIQNELVLGQDYLARIQERIADASNELLDPLLHRADETERRRIESFADIVLGKRKVFTNQCAGVHYPFLPADEFFDRCHFPWFESLEAATDIIVAELSELLATDAKFIRPYVRQEEGTPENLWSELDNSLDWGACFLWEYGVPNQSILDRVPQTAAIIEKLPLQRIAGRAPNVFFSLLAPGKHIPPHTGVTNTRAIVHLGLNIPPGCDLRVGGEVREWIKGEAFAFDDTIEHEARNRSDRRRAVLILDTWNPHLTDLEKAAISAHFALSDRALASP